MKTQLLCHVFSWLLTNISRCTCLSEQRGVCISPYFWKGLQPVNDNRLGECCGLQKTAKLSMTFSESKSKETSLSEKKAPCAARLLFRDKISFSFIPRVVKSIHKTIEMATILSSETCSDKQQVLVSLAFFTSTQTQYKDNIRFEKLSYFCAWFSACWSLSWKHLLNFKFQGNRFRLNWKLSLFMILWETVFYRWYPMWFRFSFCNIGIIPQIVIS